MGPAEEVGDISGKVGCGMLPQAGWLSRTTTDPEPPGLKVGEQKNEREKRMGKEGGMGIAGTTHSARSQRV